MVAMGAVSVEPQAEVIGTVRPVVRRATSSSRVHISGVSAAPA